MKTLDCATEAESKIIADVRGIAANLLGTGVISVQRIGGGGNNRIYHLECDGSQQYAAKLYFRHSSDKRDRLEVEFSSLLFLWEEGIRNIPQPIVVSRDESCVIYEFIEGTKILAEDITADDIQCAVDFLAKLNELKKRPRAKNIPMASEACFSVQAIVENISVRLNRLNTAAAQGPEHAEFKSFLTDNVSPVFDTLRDWSYKKCNQAHIPFDIDLGWEERTLSPSDFGFHNTLRDKTGRIVFLDFEYFGWDDPAKMICDFLLHPAMKLGTDLKGCFFKRIYSAFEENQHLAERVAVVYPLFGLKWCLILLNEFIPDDLQRRSFARMRLNDKKDIEQGQLLKAKKMLAFTRETYQDFPYSI